MSKILITGAGGFLGVRASAYFKEHGWQVVDCDHKTLDITDLQAVQEVFQKEKPQYVLHCAAISDTGYSQEHPDLSEAINLHGTEHVAAACAACKAKLVYLSSDQVYNGNSEMYALPEDIALDPKNVYGVHKLQAERSVADICPDGVGLRLTWLYDRPDSRFRMNRNLLVNLKQAAESGQMLKGAVHELRGITYVWDAVENLEKCFTLPGGVYNYGCENPMNTYETLRAAAEICGYDADRLVQKDETFYRNLSMDTKKIRAYGIEFPETVEGVRRAVRR